MKREEIGAFIILFLIIIIALFNFFPSIYSTDKTEILFDVTYILDSDCEYCINEDVADDFVKFDMEIKISSKNIFEIRDAKDLIDKYSIKNYPTILISSPSFSRRFKNEWKRHGKFIDNTFVLENLELIKGYVYKEIGNNNQIVMI